MKIRRQTHGEAIAFSLEGQLDMYGSPELRDHVRDAVQSAPRLVVVDLSGVTYMDSTGLAVLIEALRATRAKGGEFRLSGLSPVVMNQMRMLGILSVLDARPTLADALADLSHGPQELRCLLTQCPGTLRLATGSTQTGLRCPCCQSRIELAGALGERGPIALRQVSVPSYEGQAFGLEPGPGFEVLDGRLVRLVVHGRLDLFSTGALRPLLQTVPAAARILWDFARCQDVTADGIEALRTTSRGTRLPCTALPHGPVADILRGEVELLDGAALQRLASKAGAEPPSPIVLRRVEP